MARRTSYTQLTLKRLREIYGKDNVAKVEYWQAVPNHPGGGVRKDLFGIIDIIALDLHCGLIRGIQSTGPTGMSSHRKLLLGERVQATRNWLSIPGNRLEIWSWRKKPTAVGSKRLVWTLRAEEITIEQAVMADSRK